MMKTVAVLVLTVGCVTGDNGSPIPDDAIAIEASACRDFTGGTQDGGAWRMGGLPSGDMLVTIPADRAIRYFGFVVQGEGEVTVLVNVAGKPGEDPFPIVLKVPASSGFVVGHLPLNHADTIFILPSQSGITVSDMFVSKTAE